MSNTGDGAFEMHPQLAADTIALGDLPLCRLLLMNDAHYPWFILVPRRASVREIYELDEADRAQLWRESLVLSRSAMRAFTGYKLNLAALGNAVPQLHLHHIVRHQHDPAWPAPVWGKLSPKRYEPAALNRCVESFHAALPAAFQRLVPKRLR